MSSTVLTADRRSIARRAARASFIGTTVEWYDFFIYATAAALVLGPQFFPAHSTLASTLAAYTTLAIGFIARPLGGVVIGHYGDRLGRKRLLVLSLVIMGSATFLIGLLPNYHAIGVWAPILLVVLRFAQGFGVGGEWGGAVLMAVESAPESKRTFYGSFPQMGLPAGIIVSNVVFLVIGEWVSPASFQSWGWRLPFLVSAVLVAYGLIIRVKILESPEFAAIEASGDVVKAPLVEVIRTQPRTLLLASAGSIAAPALGYLVLVYMLGYGKSTLHQSQNTMLTLIIVGSVVWLAVIAASAVLADRIGRKPVFLAAAALTTLWAYPFFALVDTRSIPLMVIAFVVGSAGIAGMSGPQAALVADLFPAAVRYSGSSIVYQVGAVLGGAVAPILATALFAAYGSSGPIALYMVAMGLVSLLAIAALKVPAAENLATTVAIQEISA